MRACACASAFFRSPSRLRPQTPSILCSSWQMCLEKMIISLKLAARFNVSKQDKF
uniref:Uncharacterized protein n=1 Tax=Anguilla anguilla TaxID=7936 RepID=A0A0E9PM05_ANGAN